MLMELILLANVVVLIVMASQHAVIKHFRERRAKEIERINSMAFEDVESPSQRHSNDRADYFRSPTENPNNERLSHERLNHERLSHERLRHERPSQELWSSRTIARLIKSK
jgi:hypothetical protein